MDAKNKIEEVDTSNDDRPKMEKIKYYWTEQQTIDINNLLKEYQDAFSRDYNNIKVLVQEMGEIRHQTRC